MKNSYIYLVILIVLHQCASTSNADFLIAQKANTVESYNSFIDKHSNSPQTLKAKIELEKLNGNPNSQSSVKFSSENSIDVIQKDGRFIETKGNLKKIFDFYKSKFKREYFTSQDGVKIAYDYMPVPGAKQALIISHGTGESSIRYAEAVFDLINNKVPYSIFIINHRGHGYSERLLGKNKSWNPEWDVYKVTQPDILEYRKIHSNGFEYYIKDFAQLVDIIKDKYQFARVTALGHSLGGGVVARYAEEYPDSLEKMVLTAPMMSIVGALGADNYDFVSKAIISIKDTFSHESYTFGGEKFNHLVTKYDTEKNSLNDYTTSHNRFYMKKYIIQEFPETSLGGLTWGFADSIYEAVKDIREDADKIKIPTLIFQSEYDSYVHPSGQNKVCEIINEKKPGNCKIRKIKNAKHELLLERDSIRNNVMQEVIEFLN